MTPLRALWQQTPNFRGHHQFWGDRLCLVGVSLIHNVEHQKQCARANWAHWAIMNLLIPFRISHEILRWLTLGSLLFIRSIVLAPTMHTGQKWICWFRLGFLVKFWGDRLWLVGIYLIHRLSNCLVPYQKTVNKALNCLIRNESALLSAQLSALLTAYW